MVSVPPPLICAEAPAAVSTIDRFRAGEVPDAGDGDGRGVGDLIGSGIESSGGGDAQIAGDGVARRLGRRDLDASQHLGQAGVGVAGSASERSIRRCR